MAQTKNKKSTNKNAARSGQTKSKQQSKTAAKTQTQPIRREVAAIVSAFAALLTGISVFSSDGIIVGAISSLLKGLFGYGFWLCAPALVLVAVIQGFHHGRPVAFKTTSALLMPLLLGALVDLMFSTVIVENLKGVGAVLGGLYAGGKDVGAVLGEIAVLARDLLISTAAPEGGASLLSGGYDANTMKNLLALGSGARFIQISTILQTATAELQFSVNRRTDAELCLLKLCDETLSGDLTALGARIARLEEQLAAVERKILENALRRHDGNRAAAGRELGVSPRMMNYRLNKAGLGK